MTKSACLDPGSKGTYDDVSLDGWHVLDPWVAVPLAIAPHVDMISLVMSVLAVGQILSRIASGQGGSWYQNNVLG